MSLIANIPSGQTEITVNGLHQWDYGRNLEISAEGLPSIVEVHFACAGMTEATVRVAPLEDGAVTVSIPDKCLEQTTPIKAWVYLINDTSGRTAISITLTVIPRIKPAPIGSAEVESTAESKYDQLFGLMEEAYDAIEACKNVDANAEEAQSAATSALQSASSAIDYANQAEASAEQAEIYSIAAKASADSVAEVSIGIEQCLTKAPALIEVGENNRFYTSSVQNKKAFFYAFLVDTDTAKTTSLGFFIWNGIGTVELYNGWGLGLRVDFVSAAATMIEGRATLLYTNIISGEVIEFEPRPSNMMLYLQRFDN